LRSMTGDIASAATSGKDVFTPASTALTLRRACAAAELDAEGARLMRLGSNAVYRLADPVVARISRRQADAKEARRAVDVARWLESVDYPAVRALAVEQPITVDGFSRDLLRVVLYWNQLIFRFFGGDQSPLCRNPRDTAHIFLGAARNRYREDNACHHRFREPRIPVKLLREAHTLPLSSKNMTILG
jgi:hypothetical protein